MDSLFNQPKNDFEFIDFNLSFDSENVMITNPLELFLQEVRLAIVIGPEELWGFKDSIPLTKYLFNKYITVNKINSELTEFIGLYCEHAKYFEYSITTTLHSIDNNEFILIQLEILNVDSEPIIKKFILGQ